MQPMIQLNVRLPLEVYERLKADAQADYSTPSQVARTIICKDYDKK